MMTLTEDLDLAPNCTRASRIRTSNMSKERIFVASIEPASAPAPVCACSNEPCRPQQSSTPGTSQGQ